MLDGLGAGSLDGSDGKCDPYRVANVPLRVLQIGGKAAAGPPCRSALARESVLLEAIVEQVGTKARLPSFILVMGCVRWKVP
jgi:hypothetical protein